jgi:hypothetical protein
MYFISRTMKERGSLCSSPYVCVLHSKSNLNICTHLGGALPIFSSLVERGSSLCKSMVLSSIAKKGEIERAFPSLSDFGVDDKTIST